ncbi:hypothetical protein HRbin21_01477 [bacterium HR21]|nr:hypothetical protein HRbin21_01477 [bacterium HR21]
MVRQTVPRGRGTKSPIWTFPLGKRNWRIIGLGLALLVVGYGLMSIGIFTRYDNPIAMVVAPLVLVVAYLVIVPAGILTRSKGSSPGASQ